MVEYELSTFKVNHPDRVKNEVDVFCEDRGVYPISISVVSYQDIFYIYLVTEKIEKPWSP